MISFEVKASDGAIVTCTAQEEDLPGMHAGGSLANMQFSGMEIVLPELTFNTTLDRKAFCKALRSFACGKVIDAAQGGDAIAFSREVEVAFDMCVADNSGNSIKTALSTLKEEVTTLLQLLVMLGSKHDVAELEELFRTVSFQTTTKSPHYESKTNTPAELRIMLDALQSREELPMRSFFEGSKN